jgi:hypothetical protein
MENVQMSRDIVAHQFSRFCEDFEMYGVEQF